MGRANRGKPADPVPGVVEDLATDGRGVLHREGKAVFIADCLPGEEIIYRPRRRNRHLDEGTLETVVTAAPERVEPRCAHFGVCGGCALQHADEHAQLGFKQKQVLDALSRVGKVSPETVVEPIRGATWGYRRRARLGAKHVPKKGGTLVGFRERGTPFITRTESCHVLAPVVGLRLQALAELIDGLSVRKALPQIEVAVADNACALVLRVLEEPSEGDLARLQAFAAAHSVWFFLQRGGPDTVVPLSRDTPELHYRLDRFDVTLAFQPGDFIQVNAQANEAMVAQALEWLAPTPQMRVLELFAGLGNFTLPLARRAGQVVSVEGDAGLVRRAGENAARNGLDNITPHVADLFAPGERPAWLRGPFDAVLLDPPRSGAQEMVPLIAAGEPQCIVYVSCHPATLARDAGELVHRHGYRLKRAGVIDMFPHTAHVESMALFERS